MEPVIQAATPLSARNEAAPVAAHLAYLDGLRAVTAVYVVLGHAVMQVWPEAATRGALHGWPLAIATAFGFGHTAVSVFIVLSGFCLMLPVVRSDGTLRGGALTFFRRRARRILPPYYLAALVSLALIATVIGDKSGTHWDVTLPVTGEGILEHLFLVQNFRGAPQINHVFWSIAVEWQIYFFFPLLVWLWRRVSPSAVVAGAVAVGYAAHYFVRAASPDAAVHYFGLFALGMLGCAIAHAREGSLARARDEVPWPAVAAVATLVAALLWLRLRYALSDGCVGVMALAVLVMASRGERSPLRRVLSLRPLVWIGGFAYSLYLIHAPILQLVTLGVVRPLGLEGVPACLATMCLGTPISIAGARLFYLACERPFIAKR